MKGHVPKVEKEEERQWIQNVLDGHKEDYSFLVNRYKNKIYGLLRGMGANDQDAQDITQETFMKAYLKLASHDLDRIFAAWLYTIAANLLKDLWKGTRPTASLPDDLTELSLSDNPEEEFIRSEHRTEILHLIQKLPPNYRKTLFLRYTNDLSYEEMCVFLDVPLSKIQNNLYRAKQRLKQILSHSEVKSDEVLKSI
ncbi:sigma-70 family RNA polymerase sigma factor [Paenibacillus sp. FSL R10-2734]|uniref:RNA polymerase sigma factor n=1 Tax=Paenibacillus sp. FSL R10-2734 TaxID=2954691 RepID=UPI0030D9682F